MDIKIGVGVSTYGVVKSKTALSLIEMMKLPYEFFPIFQYGPYISQNREFIVETAVKQECTHLLFVDYDIQFYPVTIDILVKHDLDIVAALYNYRHFPITPMVKLFNDKGEVINGEQNKIPDETFKVAGIGMGCCLIKMPVFEKIKKPYFPMYSEEGKVVTSEDIGFCEKVREAGFDIWCDPSLTIKHIGEYEY